MLQPPQNRTLTAYQEIKDIAGAIARRGWRPAFCWVGVFVPLWAYIIAPRDGIQIDLSQVNMFASIVLGAFVMRGVEKIKGAH